MGGMGNLVSSRNSALHTQGYEAGKAKMLGDPSMIFPPKPKAFMPIQIKDQASMSEFQTSHKPRNSFARRQILADIN